MLLNYKDILDSLYGIAYLVDRDGYLVDYGEKNWNDFANSNDTKELTNRQNVIGKKIYDFVSGEETKESYRKINETLFSGLKSCIYFHYRCDAPDFRRDMKMSITPIKVDGYIKYLLYQSLVISETMRPPINILKKQSVKSEESENLVNICSYCKSIKIVRYLNGIENISWVAPEDYYRLGGREDVLLSHGICPSCYENIVLKFTNSY